MRLVVLWVQSTKVSLFPSHFQRIIILFYFILNRKTFGRAALVSTICLLEYFQVLIVETLFGDSEMYEHFILFFTYIEKYDSVALFMYLFIYLFQKTDKEFVIPLHRKTDLTQRFG